MWSRILLLPICCIIFSMPLKAQSVCDNRSLDFDGIDDWIQLSNSPVQGTGAFTIECWFLSEDNDGLTGCSGNFERIIGLGGNRFELGTCGNTLAVVAGSGTANLTSATVVNGAWHHLAATFTGSTGSPFNYVNIYLNGNLVWWGNAALSLDNNFRIGRWPGSSGLDQVWKGRIDELRIWNFTRSRAEIIRTRNCELVGNEPGLVDYYNFNQGIPNGNNSGLITLLDMAGTPNNGTLFNFGLNGNTSNWVCRSGLCTCDCSNNLVQNPGFFHGAVFGSMCAGAASSNWICNTNTPQIIKEDSVCNAVSLQMWGNKDVGESVRQTGFSFIAGRTYQVSFFARFLDQTTLPTKYVRFGLKAANGSVNPYSCTTTCEIIGTTSNITNQNWAQFTLPAWTPSVNSTDLIIYTFNNNTDIPGDATTVSWGRIDNICIQDVTPPPPCAADFTFQPIGNCGNIQFTNTSVGLFTYSWNFGDGSALSTAQHPIHQFTVCGTFNVCLTITGQGCTKTVCKTVNITDAVPPVAKCANVNGFLGANCTLTVTPGHVNAGSTDNCQIQSMSLSPNTFTQCGTFPVTLTVTDWCGNTSSCVGTVQVLESVPPVITCPPNLNKDCNTNLLPPATGTATATDNCGPAPVISFTDITTGLMPCNGLIIRTWKAVDSCGNSATCQQVITVRDTIAPVILNCPKDTTITGTYNASGICSAPVQLPMPTATDNCDINVTLTNSFNGTNNASGTYPAGTTTVAFTATDDCGNKAQCRFKVIVVCPPKFNCDSVSLSVISSSQSGDTCCYKLYLNNTNPALISLINLNSQSPVAFTSAVPALGWGVGLGATTLQWTMASGGLLPTGTGILMGTFCLDANGQFPQQLTAQYFEVVGTFPNFQYNLQCTDTLITKCQNCATPPSDMTGWWSMEETSGTIIKDIAGGHNGTAQPGPVGAFTGTGPVTSTAWPPPTFPAGMVNNSLFFEGFRYIKVPSHPDLEPGTGGFTVDAWVLFDINQGGFGLMNIAEKLANPARWQFYISYPVNGTSGLLNFQVRGASGGLIQGGFDVPLSPLVWHHVAVTLHRGTQDTVKLYLDGVLGSTRTFPSVGNVSGSTDMLIGTGNLSGREIAIDELEIFKRALTPAEIHRIWAAGSLGKCKQGSICGVKFNDLNGNGIQETGEPGLQGWTINLSGTTNTAAVTDSSGKYCFNNLPQGTYHVCEVLQPGWTTPRLCVSSISIEAGQAAVVNFGNRRDTCISPPQGMVAWWPLDETFGNIVFDEPQAGGNNNGNTIGGAINSGFGIMSPGPGPVPKKVDGHLYFFNPDMNYIEVPALNSANLNFGTTQDFSIDAWIFHYNQPGYMPVVDKRDPTGQPTGYMFFVDGAPTPRLKFILGGVGYQSVGSIAWNGWHHVAVTVDRATSPGTVKLYIDGQLDGSPIVNLPPTAIASSTKPLRIGGTHLLPSVLSTEYALDEIEIFDRVLSPSEIRLLYLADTLGKCKKTPGSIFPCDSLWVTKDSIIFNPGTVQDTCCWSVDLNVHAGPVAYIEAEILTPGVVFDNPSTSSDFQWGNLPTGSLLSIVKQPLSKGIPQGGYSDALTFCLDNISNAAQDTQCVVFRWYALNAVDEPFLACTDTLYFYCPLPPTDSCCRDKNIISQVLANNISLSADHNLCKATLNIGNLPTCYTIEWINWGDGSPVAGPYSSGTMVMHNYNQSGLYIISYLAVVVDPNTGKICFEKIVRDTLRMICPEFCRACAPNAPLGPNLIVNGDFSAGNAGFASAYNFAPAGGLVPGDYSIRNSTNLVNPQWANLDHTVGLATGNFLVCDGDLNPGIPCWQTTVAVEKGSQYNFCAFVNNLVVASKDYDDPIIEVRINNVAVATVNLSENPDKWVLLNATWTANSNSAQIEIRSISDKYIGNDFAVDDISLYKCSYTCCRDYELFSQTVVNAVSICLEDAQCKASVKIDGLPACDSVLYVSWGDGHFDWGPFSNNTLNHYYAQSGTYNINVVVFEYNKHGKPCFDKILQYTVKINCRRGAPANLVQNSGFNKGVVGGAICENGATDFWICNTRSPKVVLRDSCCDGTSLEMWGNANKGESVRQKGISFVKGQTYQLHFSARFLNHAGQSSKNVRFGFVASNGYADPYKSGNYELIAISPEISGHNWATFSMPPWTANSNWTDLIIYAYNDQPDLSGDEATMSGGRIDNINIFMDAAVDAKEAIDWNTLLFYPNPVNERLYIVPPKGGKWTAEIWLTDGRLVQNNSFTASPSEHAELDVSNLRAGIYFVKIMNEELQFVVKKFVKQ